MTRTEDPADTSKSEALLAHQPSDDPLWQESLAFYWLDEANGVAGGHRLAHEPVRGLANRHSGIITSDGLRYRAAESTLELAPGDRAADRMAAGTQSIRLDGDNVRLELRDDDCECDLVFVDAHRPVGYPDAPASVAETAPQHFESSGTVSGAVRVGGETYEVDGLFHRDHSWGPRRWDWVLSHRWVAGTLRSGTSFSLFSVHDREGGLVTGGYVARDGTVLGARDVDIVVHLEPDGLTHRGGVVSASTSAGPIHLECTAVDGFVWGHRELTYADGICRVRSNEGDGFCCFEVANNPHAGAAPPSRAINACLADGLSRRDRGAWPPAGKR